MRKPTCTRSRSRGANSACCPFIGISVRDPQVLHKACGCLAANSRSLSWDIVFARRVPGFFDRSLIRARIRWIHEEQVSALPHVLGTAARAWMLVGALVVVAPGAIACHRLRCPSCRLLPRQQDAGHATGPTRDRDGADPALEH